MQSENRGIIYCADDDEYRIYCDNCDKLFIERFYKNHPKPGTDNTSIRKRQQL